MFIATVIATVLLIAIGWKCWLTITDRNTSQKKAALAGAVMAAVVVALGYVTATPPNN